MLASSQAVQCSHEGNEGRVHGGEEDIGSPANVCNHDGSDHYDHEVDTPIHNVSQGGPLSAVAERIDLCSVQPGNCKVCGAKEGNVTA